LSSLHSPEKLASVDEPISLTDRFQVARGKLACTSFQVSSKPYPNTLTRFISSPGEERRALSTEPNAPFAICSRVRDDLEACSVVVAECFACAEPYAHPNTCAGNSKQLARVFSLHKTKKEKSRRDSRKGQNPAWLLLCSFVCCSARLGGLGAIKRAHHPIIMASTILHPCRW
jgi:hypothetical protein